MAIDFPASPTNGQTYTVGSVTYTYDGTKWTALASGGSSQWTTTGSNIYYTSGSVGIGASSPNELLEVRGTANQGIRITSTDTSGEGSNLQWYTELTGGNKVTAEIESDASGTGGNLQFKTTNTSGTLTEAARFDNAQRFLVGTSGASGNARLQVRHPDSTDSIFRLLRSGDDLTTFDIDYSAATGGVTLGPTNPSANTNNFFLGFKVGGAERMRISANGSTNFFNSTSTTFVFGSALAAGTSDNFMLGLSSRSTNTSGGNTEFVVRTNGNVLNTNNSYGSISDIKLKENIVDASSQWDDLKALQVRNYNFKEGQTHTQIGLIAQEVELVSPGLVSECPDRDAEGNDLGTVTKSVNYSVLYMKAVKALQEAMDRIETLEAKVAALEAS